MDFETITYVLLAYLTAAFLKGIAGLGFSTICLGILAGFIDLRLAIPLVILPSVASNLLVMIEAGNFTQILHRHRLLYAGLLPGLATGLWFLVTWNPAILTRLLGTILVLYGIWSLANPRFTMSPALASGLKIPTGFLTGLIGNPGYSAWIGALQEGDEWAWCDGSPVDYQAWQSQTPAGSSAATLFGNGVWSETPREDGRWFICEWQE